MVVVEPVDGVELVVPEEPPMPDEPDDPPIVLLPLELAPAVSLLPLVEPVPEVLPAAPAVLLGELPEDMLPELPVLEPAVPAVLGDVLLEPLPLEPAVDGVVELRLQAVRVSAAAISTARLAPREMELFIIKNSLRLGSWKIAFGFSKTKRGQVQANAPP